MEAGDRLPAWVGVAADGRLSTPDRQAGRAALILLDNRADAAVLAKLVEAAAAHRAALAASGADLFLVGGFSTGPAAWSAGPAAAHDIAVVLSPGAFLQDCDVAEGTATAVLIDRDRRIVALGDDVAALVGRAALLAPEASRRLRAAAPLLVVPFLLEEALCGALVARVREAAGSTTGLHPLETSDRLHGVVADRIRRRCLPDMRRAFQHRGSGWERFSIVRYDATGGHVRRHRGDASASSADRRFALSVNLNAGAYEGGFLRFPEFDDQDYATGTGDGLVHSAALLQEATAVTRGARYALEIFFRNGDAG